MTLIYARKTDGKLTTGPFFQLSKYGCMVDYRLGEMPDGQKALFALGPSIRPGRLESLVREVNKEGIKENMKFRKLDSPEGGYNGLNEGVVVKETGATGIFAFGYTFFQELVSLLYLRYKIARAIGINAKKTADPIRRVEDQILESAKPPAKEILTGVRKILMIVETVGNFCMDLIGTVITATPFLLFNILTILNEATKMANSESYIVKTQRED